MIDYFHNMCNISWFVCLRKWRLYIMYLLHILVASSVAASQPKWRSPDGASDSLVKIIPFYSWPGEGVNLPWKPWWDVIPLSNDPPPPPSPTRKICKQNEIWKESIHLELYSCFRMDKRDHDNKTTRRTAGLSNWVIEYRYFMFYYFHSSNSKTIQQYSYGSWLHSLYYNHALANIINKKSVSILVSYEQKVFFQMLLYILQNGGYLQYNHSCQFVSKTPP